MPRASTRAAALPRPKLPGNAGERRTLAGSSLGGTIEDALPLLLRRRVIDAVLEAQDKVGAPVTSQEARSATRRPLLRHVRAFTELCWRVCRLGPDERGRSLHAAGKDRKGLALWWVQEPDG